MIHRPNRLSSPSHTLAALCVVAAISSLPSCVAVADDEIPAALQDENDLLLPSLQTVALPCFEPVEGDLTLDTIPIWRTGKPLAPLGLKPMFGRTWSSASTIAIRGTELAVTDEHNGAVVFLHAPTLAKLRVVKVGVRPAQLLYGPNGTLWVTVRGDGTVASIKTGATTATKTKVGAEPIGIAMSQLGEHVYVALAAEGRVVALDAKSSKTIASLGFNVPGRPRALAVTDLGGSPRVERVVVARQHGPAFVRHIRHLPGTPSFDNRTADLRDANPGHLAAGDHFGLPAWRSVSATIHPGTGDALVPHVLVFTGDDMAAPNAGGAPESGAYASDPGARCSSTPLRPIEVTVSAIAHQTTPPQAKMAVRDPFSRRQLLARFDQPSSIAHHRGATVALVTAAGTDNVLILNTALADPMRAPLGEITVGAHPDGIIISGAGDKAYVRDGYGTSISEIDLQPVLVTVTTKWLTDDNGTPTGPRMAPRFLAAKRNTKFSDDGLTSRMRRGREIFHRTKNTKTTAAWRFACASCHFEGGDDKQIWHIGDGPRQTPALAGRLAGTAPFNWKGTETDLLGNMRQTVQRMGGHGLSGTEEKALELFLLNGLPAPLNPRHGQPQTPAELRGQKIFFAPEVGCASCHSPPTFTDGKQHQIGTVEADDGGSNLATHCSAGAAATNIEVDAVFDTPSLLGLRHSAPYLHDGSAATLKEVLERTAGTMGNTADLDGNQRADLIAFLRTL